MRQLLVGIIIGLGAATLAYGQMRPDSPELQEVLISRGERNGLTIPRAYGRLASVAVTADIHHLYFEDASGTIRIVRIGPGSAAQRGRYETELLTPDVHVVSREPAAGAE
ncbi:MAG: hypothetical protein Q8S13_02515 [Dehalococcoidia bacterium]|nr:hypothetical protein [Dehalococcoidia bacterium]